MQKKYKIIFLLFIACFINLNCKALMYAGCDYENISKLKLLVNNVNISYTYIERDNNAYFNVVLNNIPKDTYFVDSSNDKIYTYDDTENGEIVIESYSDVKSGQYNFYVNNNICNGLKLGTKYYEFPMYNKKYTSELCSDIPNFSMCKKWISRKYSDSEFEEKIKEYKESLITIEENTEQKIEYKKDLIVEILELYAKYYYYFLPVIIAICLIVIVISKRKNRFKL